MKQTPPSWVGRTFRGRYHVQSLLREGEIFSIYYATDKRAKRPVTIHMIHSYLSQEAKFRPHFKQEISTAMRLRHPAIRQIYDFACTEEACYIVWQHVQGDTLAERLSGLKQGNLRLPFDDTISIMKKLCEALAYAHEHDIFHCDLNPSHVIIDSAAQPVITHFGMAKLLCHHTLPQAATTIKTVTYMSPERISGQPIDHRADIYALGVILYEMIVGRPPFVGDTITDVIEKHKNEPVPDIRHFNSRLPYGMMTVLQKALAKNPDQRFWSAREMTKALQMMSLKTVILPEEKAEPTPVLVEPLSADGTPSSTGAVKKRSWLQKGILLCGLLLVTVLSVLLLFWILEGQRVSTTPEPVVTPSVSTNATQTEEPSPPAQPTAENKLPSSENMVKIAGGAYLMGPEARVEVMADFWIDQFEVTNAEYAEFISQSGAVAPDYWQEQQIPEKMANHPVREVSWQTADAYCAWVNKRLPSEIEWEVAARGPYRSLFPWGNQQEMVTLPEQESYPVGTVLENRSFFGSFDMAGNVAEWVNAPYLSQNDQEHVLRGGKANSEEAMMGRLTGQQANESLPQAGFRCASTQVELKNGPTVLLDDQFNDPASGWWQADAPVDGYFYGYEGNQFYQLALGSPNSCLSVHHEMLTDHIMIEADLFMASPETIDAQVRYGVTFRATNNNFYAFVLSPHNQGWQVLKSSAEGFLLMDEGASERIKGIKEEVIDKVVVIANFSEFAFFVNGELVSRVHDNQYHSGSIGFMVETFEQYTTQIHVDSITVWALPTRTQRSATIDTSPARYPVNSPICKGSVLNSNRLTRFISHTVRKGENLNQIAERYGVPMTEILAASGKKITNPNLIKRGQIVIIPQ